MAEDDRVWTVRRLRWPIRIQIIRDALCGEADVVESEIARDDAAPAGGAEFNCREHET